MTFDEFVAKWTGNPADYDGAFGFQCVDLFNFYNRDVIGEPWVGTHSTGGAADLWNDHAQLPGYTKVANTPDGIPPKGAVVVWFANTKATGPAGHVGIASGEGNKSSFTSFDQNYPTGSLPHMEMHTYVGVAGWYVPIVNPGDTNAPSPATVDAPTADNEGVVNGQGLRGREHPVISSAATWTFDDNEHITLLERTVGDNVTTGPYAPSNSWYLAHGNDANAQAANYPKVWVADAYVRTTKTPANVPDYVPEAGTPSTPPVSQFSVRPGTGLFGIDISAFQGVIDWALLKPAIDFVIIRAGHVGASFGGNANNGDPKYAEYKAAARASGIPVSSYWYGFPPLDPKIEAASFALAVADFLPGESIFLDLEEEADHAADWAKAFCDEAERLMGRPCHLYTGFDFYTTYHMADVLTDLLAGDRRLWVAHYDIAAGQTVIDGAVMHQYTSDGTLPGITGRVDLNLFYGSRSEFLALGDPLTSEADSTPPVPAPQPPQPPSAPAASGSLSGWFKSFLAALKAFVVDVLAEWRK